MMHMNQQIMIETISYFRWHNEIHETKTLLSLIKFMSPEEADLFDIDLRKIDMDIHAQYFMYGVGKYYQHLDLLPPDAPL